MHLVWGKYKDGLFFLVHKLLSYVGREGYHKLINISAAIGTLRTYLGKVVSYVWDRDAYYIAV